MKVKVQFCWAGGDRYYFRALICGGLRIRTETSTWTRRHAKEMLDLICAESSLNRSSIRFIHV